MKNQKEEKWERVYKILLTIAIILVIAATIYGVITGRKYFTRRSLRLLEGELKPFGIWSPVAVFGLIFVSILIPPLPIPIPLMEIVCGMLFGFWPGVILAWFAQVTSSIAAFLLSRTIGKRFLQGILKNKFISLYKDAIKEKGALAVFVIRTFMAAPFSISYLVGFMQMNMAGFIVATGFGVIPEATFFVYLGTLILHTRIRLGYIFLIIGLLSLTGPLYIFVANLLKKKKRS
jgi:uncharacterized membrane protein YdjX (TVP38/TMEM64 family)